MHERVWETEEGACFLPTLDWASRSIIVIAALFTCCSLTFCVGLRRFHWPERNASQTGCTGCTGCTLGTTGLVFLQIAEIPAAAGLDLCTTAIRFWRATVQYIRDLEAKCILINAGLLQLVRRGIGTAFATPATPICLLKSTSISRHQAEMAASRSTVLSLPGKDSKNVAAQAECNKSDICHMLQSRLMVKPLASFQLCTSQDTPCANLLLRSVSLDRQA